ncbi:hypothetical protein G9A89_011657 [Geosiphon pyriformis]|nr:hypothetical protein G9A89_011657 [Geosiphon pyriformis]
MYDKSKLFLLDYEAIVGPSIAVMKKTVESSGSVSGFKAVLSRKKRRGSVLKDNAGAKEGSAKVQSGHSWSLETGDTTESDSVDMEEECLVEETSFNYGEGGALVDGDLDQTPKGSQVTTRKALGKPLGKINFLDGNDDDDVLLNVSLVLLPPLKNLVNVSVKKLFALDLDLKAVEGNLAQEKLKKIRSLFSGINGFGEASTPSKFSRIIRVTFTSKSGLMKTTEKATADLATAEWSILIGKDAVRVARADLDKEVWDVRDQHRALLYTLPMGTTAHNIWDFIRSVGGKTCIIDRHSVTYAWARCAVVCFDSAESLDAAVGTTPVLRNTNLHWSCLISAKCAKCEKLGHTSLDCAVGGKFSSGSLLHRVFSNMDKSRLAIIYAKRLAPVARPVSFGGLSWAKVARGCFSSPLSGQNIVMNNGSSSEMKPSQQIAMEVNDRFAALECSLASLAEQVGKLAKRLDALGPTVPQPSPGCQLLVTPSLQDQGADVVMSEGSNVSTSGGNVAGAVSFDMSSVSKLEDSIKCLMETVLGLSAKVDSIGALSVSLPLTQ